MGMGHTGYGERPWKMTQSTLGHNAELSTKKKKKKRKFMVLNNNSV
jgi:hypothetical protein